jgi:hypothetical protein
MRLIGFFWRMLSRLPGLPPSASAIISKSVRSRRVRRA